VSLRRRKSGQQEVEESREERKRRTRDSLREAALHLMEQGRSFSSLSLREVTREAGIVPTAFYRHFRSMDELGFELVEEGGVTLRRLLREARSRDVPLTDVLRNSVLIYERYIEDNRLKFRFVASERGSGSPAIRDAIRKEVAHFVNEMAQDLRRFDGLDHLTSASLQMICGLIVNTMLGAAVDILDLPAGQPQLKQELIDNLVDHLRLILLGAQQWRNQPKPAALRTEDRARR
jgi:AcrR family transcriptional regulator